MTTTAKTTEIKLTKRIQEVEFENKILKEEISRLILMIDNGWGWEDAKKYYSQSKKQNYGSKKRKNQSDGKP